MNFKKLEISDIETLYPFFASIDDERYGRLCEYSLASPIMWRDLYNCEICTEDGIFYIRARYGTNPKRHYSIPICPKDTLKTALLNLKAFCDKNGENLLLSAICENMLPEVLEVFPDSIVTSDEASYDYIYSADDLRTFAGRKYSGKRNHLNKFLSLYPDWCAEKLSRENVEEIKKYLLKNLEENPKEDYPSYTEGVLKTIEVLDNFERLDLSGAAVYVDGKIIAASVGETRGDTLYVHTEKADTDIVGSYQMIVREYAKMFGEEIKFINREEDDGVEGLKKSKESYYPIRLLKKYRAAVT